MFTAFSASESDVQRRQILTSKDGPRMKEKNIDIQKKQKELTKTFMMISNWIKPLVSMVYKTYFVVMVKSVIRRVLLILAYLGREKSVRFNKYMTIIIN